MNLNGGIDMYNLFGERYNEGEAPYGRKVKYLNKGGHDYQREQANQHFQEGQILTVKEIYVGSWSSEVEFVEYPLLKFNTVMFEDIEF